MARSGVRDGFVIGGTSVLGLWITEVVRAACAGSSSRPSVVDAGRDHHVDGLGASQGPRRILLVRTPDLPVMEVLAGGTAPIVAVIDDPVDSVRLTMAKEGGDLLRALREQTASAAAHHLLLDNPAVLIVRRGASVTAREVVVDVLRHLRVKLAPAELADLVAACSGDAPDIPLEQALARTVDAYVPLNRLGEAISADEADVVRQVLSPVVFGALSRDIGYVTWPARVFWISDLPERDPPRVVNLTGTARTIYYGPYFHLPPGTWQVQLRIAFSKEACRIPFKLLVLCGAQVLATVEFKPPRAGAFSGAFVIRHTAPQDRIEINFRNEESMIEGQIALGQLSFHRIDS